MRGGWLVRGIRGSNFQGAVKNELRRNLDEHTQWDEVVAEKRAETVDDIVFVFTNFPRHRCDPFDKCCARCIAEDMRPFMELEEKVSHDPGRHDIPLVDGVLLGGS